MRKIDLVLTELHGLRADTQAELRGMNGRIDGVNARLDTGLDGLNARLDIVIDALADLRSDFDRHTHEA